MDLALLGYAAVVVFAAELPGKTTLASFYLSTRSRPLPVFLGAAAAFLIHSALAVAAGRLLALLPPRPVAAAAGVIFLVAGAWLWLEKPDESAPPQPHGRALAASFSVAFLGQWGDPSQLATAALAARHPQAPAAVFCGAVLGLWGVTALAVVLGHWSKRRLNLGLVQKTAAVTFVLIGAAALYSAVRP